MLCMPFLCLDFIQSGESRPASAPCGKADAFSLALYEGRKEGICLLHMQSLCGEVGKPAFQCINFCKALRGAAFSHFVIECPPFDVFGYFCMV